MSISTIFHFLSQLLDERRKMYKIYLDSTPNSRKILIMMAELGVPYQVQILNLIAKDHLKPEFLALNPNGKIPVLVDTDGQNDQLVLAESGAILFYLAEKYGQFIPASGQERFQVMQWLMFQMSGLGPMMGLSGHFSIIAPERIPYAIEHFGRESKRLVSVLDSQLAHSQYVAGEYSIADIACYPYCYMAVLGYGDPMQEYQHFHRWLSEIGARQAVKQAYDVDLGEVLVERLARMSTKERTHWLGIERRTTAT